MSHTILLHGGPRDGALVAVAELALAYKVTGPEKRTFTWRDLQDVSNDPVVQLREGVYVRGRKGENVTFYDWNGWRPIDP